jgi:hypothetical protein
MNFYIKSLTSKHHMDTQEPGPSRHGDTGLQSQNLGGEGRRTMSSKPAWDMRPSQKKKKKKE